MLSPPQQVDTQGAMGEGVRPRQACQCYRETTFPGLLFHHWSGNPGLALWCTTGFPWLSRSILNNKWVYKRVHIMHWCIWAVIKPQSTKAWFKTWCWTEHKGWKWLVCTGTFTNIHSCPPLLMSLIKSMEDELARFWYTGKRIVCGWVLP